MQEAGGDRVRWSVIGVGTAGRARAEAIRAEKRSELVAVHRGRHAGDVGVRVVGDVLEAIDLAQAVAVASPTAMHADHVRAVLDRGRHCVVEFPVATTPGAAAALFDLARARGKVLHVEHIELLDPVCTTLASHVRPELVTSATVQFQGQGPPGASAVELAVGNVARLHRLTAACGPVASIRAVEHEPGRLTAELVLKAGGAAAHVTFERAPYFQRKTVLKVVAAGRAWHQVNDLLERDRAPVTLIGSGSLFQVDQRRAVTRILEGGPSYVSEARILHVLDVVEALGAGRAGEVPQRSDAAASA
jgi:biliverdin reductase